MAIEEKRGCGYRKVGGLYLWGKGQSMQCDRFPYIVEPCPVCGEGIKFTRGFKWIDWKRYAGVHDRCTCKDFCPICYPLEEKYGLMFVSKQYYSPSAFVKEATNLGVSKRIPFVPKNLELGKTWILLAHQEAGERKIEDKNTLTGFRTERIPAIFYAFRPTKVEMIVTETQSKDDKFMEKLKKRGITPVVVPDDDIDHMR